MKNFYKASQFITVDMDKVDIIAHPEQGDELVKIVKEKLAEIRKQNQ